MRAAFPAAVDAFVSPSRAALLVVVAGQRKNEDAPPPTSIVLYDALARERCGSLPLGGRVVMAEWAAGAAADRWVARLTARR